MAPTYIITFRLFNDLFPESKKYRSTSCNYLLVTIYMFKSVVKPFQSGISILVRKDDAKVYTTCPLFQIIGPKSGGQREIDTI